MSTAKREPHTQTEGAGLYVHVPFCARACPYCDFDFVVGRAERLNTQIEAWLAGLRAEIEARSEELEALSHFDTLYVGGGTPSLLSPSQMRALFDGLAPLVGSAKLRECTVEFNPEHCDAARLDALAALGVDRVSLGVQSLDVDGLAQLGRAHSPERAREAIDAAHARGLRVSADLIVGWPGQDGAGLERELAELVATQVEHVSIYALTIEPDTPWPKLVRRGLRVLPCEDRQAEMLERCARVLEGLGHAHYEIASYARPGAEAAHNSKYWRWVDVVGLGPSAASVRHVSGSLERRVNPRGLAAWLEGAPPTHERLEGEQAAGEGLWLGLRRLGGLEISEFRARFGVERAWVEARIRRQLQLGNLVQRGEQLAVAHDRWLWHDSIAVDLI